MIIPDFIVFQSSRKRERNVQKLKMHVQSVQSYCFCSLKMQNLWRFPCRRVEDLKLPILNNKSDARNQWAISELLFVSVSKWVLVLNYWKGNELDLHKNTQLISIWMVVHQDSLWNWGMQQLGNGLFNKSKRRESWRHWTIRHSQRWHTENTPLGCRMKWRMESTSGLVLSKTLSSM